MANQGKTIKQIADEIGVSKQAVQKRITREPLYTCIQPYIATIGGTKYIAVVGENLVKQAFLEQQPTSVGIDTPTTNDMVVGVLKQTIETLQQQLVVKDKQIEDLTSTVKTQAESINADRQKELAGTLIEGKKLMSGADPSEPEEQPKRKGWKFWRK